MNVMFSIGLLPDLPSDMQSDKKANLGLIQIGAFEERFTASFAYWGPPDYERHWEEAIDRIVAGSSTSCLITSMASPSTASFIFWWPLYRLGNQVFIQNHILFFERLIVPFNENDPYASVRPRRTIDEDGHAISEWVTSIDDLRMFLQQKAIR